MVNGSIWFSGDIMYRTCPNCEHISHKKERKYQYLYMIEIYDCPNCTLIWHRNLPFGEVGIQFFRHVEGEKKCKCLACAPTGIMKKKLNEMKFKLYPDGS